MVLKVRLSLATLGMYGDYMKNIFKAAGVRCLLSHSKYLGTPL